MSLPPLAWVPGARHTCVDLTFRQEPSGLPCICHLFLSLHTSHFTDLQFLCPVEAEVEGLGKRGTDRDSCFSPDCSQAMQ